MLINYFIVNPGLLITLYYNGILSSSTIQLIIMFTLSKNFKLCFTAIEAITSFYLLKERAKPYRLSA